MPPAAKLEMNLCRKLLASQPESLDKVISLLYSFDHLIVLHLVKNTHDDNELAHDHLDDASAILQAWDHPERLAGRERDVKKLREALTKQREELHKRISAAQARSS